MKSFWNLICKSIYSPEFYREIPQRSFKSSMGYFFALILVLSIAMTVGIAIQTIPPTMAFLNNIGPRVLSYYPDALVITAKSGEISTNATEPYVVVMPDELKNDSSIPGNPENLLVIDTTRSTSIELFKEYKTAAWITKTDVVYYDKQSIRIQPLGQLPDGSLTKATVAKGISLAESVFRFVPALMVLLIFIVSFVARIFELIYLLFGALIVWLIFMIRKVPGDYKTAYHVSLHAITLSMIVSTIFILFGTPWIPFLPTILFVIVTIVNVKNAPKEKGPVIGAV